MIVSWFRLTERQATYLLYAFTIIFCVIWGGGPLKNNVRLYEIVEVSNKFVIEVFEK